MDLYDRTVKGMRLRPVAAKSADVAGVLFQAVTPQRWGYMPDAQQGPYGSLSISSSTDQVHVIENSEPGHRSGRESLQLLADPASTTARIPQPWSTRQLASYSIEPVGVVYL